MTARDAVEIGFKVCHYCDENKPIYKFGRYTDRRSGKQRRRNKCNSCRTKDETERYRKNPLIQEKKKENARRSQLKKYNMTQECYNKMFKEQDGKCAICKKTSEKTFNVDHCHDTGKVRGLLCWPCNIGIGYFKDDIKKLSNAIKYLGG